jgi:hypothetical protein
MSEMVSKRKHILLTESQVKRINEESEKNNLIQKLIFSKPEDILFKMFNAIPSGIPTNREYNQLIPVIDGYEIPTSMVSFRCEQENVDDELFWQLHITVNEKLRRMGIAEKLYTAFILQGNNVVSIFKNRAGTFYNEMGKSIPSDKAIENLWNKIKQNSKIQTFQLGDDNGNVIGITGELKK